ncbi:hypothetical protein F5Y16DRAFT_374484 [Xylariaceae sp. FL0255]|nr:hypothetical protein F5Y16DRAFT_374484 [Xylariaceae sp. FL0255]
MPALTYDPRTILDQNITTNATRFPATQVICAWPLSGQYGFGTRILYYILVATCVLAKHREWLRNACLAAALLLPAVASIHSVVLAALHVDNAIDMDIYGAFQLCSIGILTAPITVNFSETYFRLKTRNLIFIWTSLVLTGMLSLTVEFFRSQSHPCSFDNDGNPINPNQFPYQNADCNLNCIIGDGGPFSPIRAGGATNNIYVIPQPEIFTFGTVALLAAGASIPPVLTLIFTWEKILERNWRRIYDRNQERLGEKIDGTNGATWGLMKNITVNVENAGKIILTFIFGSIVFVIVVIGEINFWSPQVLYETELFSSVGQWSNVVATVLIILASAIVVQESNKVESKNPEESIPSRDLNARRSNHSLSIEEIPDDGSVSRGHSRSPSQESHIRSTYTPSIHSDVNENGESIQANPPLSTIITTYSQTNPPVSPVVEPITSSHTHRGKVANFWKTMGDYVGTPAAERYDDTHFQHSKSKYPKVPGEELRNAQLESVEARYENRRQHGDGDSIHSGVNSISSRPKSTRHGSEGSPARDLRRSPTSPVDRSGPSGSFDLMRISTLPTPGQPIKRRDTLEVPNRPTNLMRPRSSSRSSPERPIVVDPGQGSPRIVIETVPTTISDDDQQQSPTEE